MKELRRSENKEYKYTLAFLGYGDESDNTVIELTYNWGVSSYELGDSFQRIGIAVNEDVNDLLKEFEKNSRDSIISKPSKDQPYLVVKDPDGYHVAYRVKDLQQNIEFFQKFFGCNVIRQVDKENETTAIINFEKDDKSTTSIALTASKPAKEYNLGTGYGHLAFLAPDIYETCKSIEEKGGNVVRKPGPVKGGKTVIAFVLDPDGKKVELIQQEGWKCKFLHLMIRVGDLEKSIAFYSNLLGMKELRRSENKEYKYTLAFLGYGDEQNNTVIELTYNWGVSSYELGDSFQRIGIAVNEDVNDLLKEFEKNSSDSIVSKPSKDQPYLVVKDPDGYEVALVNEKDALSLV
jgi:lactoylglutathione lyase